MRLGCTPLGLNNNYSINWLILNYTWSSSTSETSNLKYVLYDQIVSLQIMPSSCNLKHKHNDQGVRTSLSTNQFFSTFVSPSFRGSSSVCLCDNQHIQFCLRTIHKEQSIKLKNNPERIIPGNGWGPWSCLRYTPAHAWDPCSCLRESMSLTRTST